MCNVQGKYRIGYIVWVKTLHSKCIDKLRMRHVTKIIRLQSVWVDGRPYHVKDLLPVVGSKPSSDDENDSEDSAQLVYLKSDLLSIVSDISTQLFRCKWQLNGREFIWGQSPCHPTQEECPAEEACPDLHNRRYEMNLEICHFRASEFVPV